VEGQLWRGDQEPTIFNDCQHSTNILRPMYSAVIHIWTLLLTVSEILTSSSISTAVLDSTYVLRTQWEFDSRRECYEKTPKAGLQYYEVLTYCAKSVRMRSHAGGS
jgi:hypothetical protein